MAPDGFWVMRLLCLFGTIKYGISKWPDSKQQSCESEGTKGCFRYHLKVNKGANGSCNHSLPTRKQIIISQCDPQNGELKEHSVGHLDNLHLLTNETEVSLDKQNFTVFNAKTTNEGLYIIEEHNSKKCLAQINLTVFDTTASNAALPAFHCDSHGMDSTVLYIIPGIILVIIHLAF